MKETSEQDFLTRLASKAKRKLNKQTSEENEPAKAFQATYEFKSLDAEESKSELQKRIVQLIKNNPDCDDPIGRLIDHSVFDKLSDERKQTYILKLSESYREVCAQFKY